MSERRYGERSLLEARLEDAILRSENGMVACLSFLTPRECRQAERFLRQRGIWENVWLWGGYDGAERKSLFLLPEYLLICLSEPIERTDPRELAALLQEQVEKEVCALRVVGSGFRSLTHRDYLGAILGLGLERDVLGDIAVQNPHEAVLFCTETIANFLTEDLNKVASDTVKCRRYEVDENFTDGRVYQSVRDTVASPRLDCVVAALTNLSREQAQSAIRSGLVEVEYEPTERTDLTLEPPAVLSIRGHGRFILRSFDGETRKGRLRLCADKLI